MYVVQNQTITDDIADKHFVCHLVRCKGACCQQGDLGAPLETQEIEQLEADYAQIRPFITEAGQQTIAQKGKYVLDEEGELSTPLIAEQEAECAYAVKDKTGMWSCGIEKAYLAGKTTFRKPISCHLYPLRITHYADAELDAINYDRWDICSPACSHGNELGVPLYVFLKDPLIRKYGQQWYDELVAQIEARQQDKHNTP